MTQELSVRPAHLSQQPVSAEGHREVDNDAYQRSLLVANDGCRFVAMGICCIPSESGAVARDCPCHVRDFTRDFQVRGLRAALHASEATTTASAGGAPTLLVIVPLVKSVPFAVLLMVLSVIAIVLLAVVSTSTPDSATRMLHFICAALAIIFIVPVVLRFRADGAEPTLADICNIADVLGAVSGVVEEATSSLLHYRVVGVVRVLRYVRVANYLLPAVPIRVSLYSSHRSSFSMLHPYAVRLDEHAALCRKL
ncbi:hypothetical protein LSCM1_05627 [Leishmania martiniquensis]|uniref:Ion transport domain-containing protein n=1 Tax=Leishmania martiniquensis TaxID=1580590 RepID=A0A836HS33_9TRYP|nr:hypothetical protein LSCM1_05627 [Leishmania martiniquensis]